MKTFLKIFALVAMTFGCLHNTNAQDNNDRAARRQEMQARQTERLIKDMKLSDEQKSKFEPIYARYLEEMAATRTQQNRDRQNDNKDLTDEEATARLTEQFARQAEQIQQQQLRLDIQKKYCAEFSAVLTPQQLLKVFQPQTPQMNRQGQQGGRGNRGGFGGGGPRGGFGGPGGGGFGGGDF